MDHPTASPTVQVDDDLFRVTRWDFAPGAQTGWHTHELPYAVVPLTTGPLLVQTDDGEAVNELAAGASYTRPVPLRHNVVNAGDAAFAFVEVEVKGGGER